MMKNYEKAYTFIFLSFGMPWTSIKKYAAEMQLQFLNTQVLLKLFCVAAKGRGALEVEGASDENAV